MQLLRTVRLAIEDGQWLKAWEIVTQAREKLGPPLSLALFWQKLTVILACLNWQASFYQKIGQKYLNPVFDGRKNPLEGLIEDFGASASFCACHRVSG